MRRNSLALAIVAIPLLAALSLAWSQPDSSDRRAGPSERIAVVLDVEGAIGPATSHYIQRGIEQSRERGARVVVLQMDTPGGLDTAMRDIIRAILASDVPIVTYVAPSGARAASAGTYILYASHVAAMAPATNVGAATPVQIGGESPGSRPGAGEPRTGDNPRPRDDDRQTGQQPRDPRPTSPDLPGTAMERKVVNDAVAYLRGLAELRGRNAEWAEQAVRGAASLSANQALATKVIDVVARDLPDLLTRIDGWDVKLGERNVSLDTKNLTIERMQPDWRTELLSVITNPTIAYGLLLIGIYGLLLEGYNPGSLVPGVVGVISLLLALFAFQILSVNYAGLALVGLGVAMIIAEFFIPSFGALGLGGLVAFIVGSIILFDNDVPGMDIGLPLIGGVATVGGLIVFAIAWLAGRSMQRPVVTGVQGMIGTIAEATEDFTTEGRVRYGGELWNAVTSSPLRAGQRARIARVEGLTLWVEPL